MRAVLTLGLALVAACSVNRRSPGLECGSSSDCTSGRTCDMGYCVEQPDCPMQCSSCDMSTTPPQCTIHDPMGSVMCPTGFSCTIECDVAGACGSIDCNSNACDVRCTATGACGSIDCSSSCRCDVTCASGNCGSISCPARQGGQPGLFCTASGANDQPCSSSVPRCDHC